MTDRPSTPDLLRDWARAPIAVEDTEVNEERRARVVSQLARTIRETKLERERTRRGSRIAALLAIAAVVALFLGGVWRGLRSIDAGGAVARLRPSSTGVLILRGSESRVPLANAEQALAGGDVVSTVADARAALHLASGAEASIAPSTRVALASAQAGHEQLDLSIGEVAVRVPPLGEHKSFRVQTPDAVVVVHGTAFVVRVSKRSEADGTFTEVTVSEGKVAVEREGTQVFLTHGQSWSSKQGDAKSTRAEPTPNVPTATEPPAPPASEGRTAVEPAPAAPPAPQSGAPGKPTKLAANDASALAEQNRLFGAAAAARRAGDDRAALGHLNQLITRYPESPLAPEARVERFRALKRLGQHAEAAREARRYLLDHQGGAARDEARGVALEPPRK